MIKALILYYLNIKSTHGYEIQKFIQINHMDKWTKIQSGSIYYALGKMEKEGLIVIKNTVGTGSKARKTYAITEKGKDELKEMVKEELDKELLASGSDKFLIYPILNTLDTSVVLAKVESHIEKIKAKIEYLKKWQGIKIDEKSLKVERISFEMMIKNLEYQIEWHEALIEEMDECIASSDEISDLILNFDFSEAESMAMSTKDSIEAIKQDILNNPENASEKLEELIKKLSK